VQPVTLDKRALRCLLDLAERGAAADGAKFAPRTAETWSILARCVTAPGNATITPGGPDSFPGPPPERATVTVTEAARLMGVSPGHVRRLCRTGALRARRFGARMWWIELDAVTDWRRAA
jgi:excisionase family DNA binding protein